MKNLNKTLENATAPHVSIIMPVYNNFELTKKCIDSINEAQLETTYEIIIADDGSTDETINIEKYYKNVRLIKTPQNSGFLLNVQNAVQYAKGFYVFLMNNDMIAKPKFLDYLYNTINGDSQIGVVGAAMLNEDGSIQEVGATVFDDGTTQWNCYKQKADMTKIYEVDYCSGCGILFSKEDWDKVGGLDERFVPAYYEDVDLCYKIKYILGKKIICQPKAQIYRLCGKTYSKKAKDICIKNRKKFLEKWGDKLYKKGGMSPNSFLENIFSLKNCDVHKVITILGFKIKFRYKKKKERGKK